MGRRTRRSERRQSRIESEDMGEDASIDIKKPVSSDDQMSPSTKMYYIKIIIGLLSGVFTGIAIESLGIPAPLWWIIFLIGLGIAMLIVRYVLIIPEEELSLTKLILSGTISELVIFIFSSAMSWMLLRSLLHGSIL